MVLLYRIFISLYLPEVNEKLDFSRVSSYIAVYFIIPHKNLPRIGKAYAQITRPRSSFDASAAL